MLALANSLVQRTIAIAGPSTLVLLLLDHIAGRAPNPNRSAAPAAAVAAARGAITIIVKQLVQKRILILFGIV